MHPITAQIIEMFRSRGSSQYGHEAVTQLQHGLQAALMAENEGADAELISAALLHDVGHLLHDLPDDAPDQGIDDRHEVLGERWLTKHFTDRLVEPVRLHVDAKRYLCAAEPGYLEILSEPSRQSLLLQGGPMSGTELEQFQSNPHRERAVRLRRWDDQAKDPTLNTPPIEHFAKYLDEAAGLAAVPAH
ncbi:MAG: phosphonate degradation HD-domain oxygenase [Phycisphaerales bacterium]